MLWSHFPAFFAPFSAKKLALFLKTNLMVLLQPIHTAVIRVKIVKFFFNLFGAFMTNFIASVPVVMGFKKIWLFYSIRWKNRDPNSWIIKMETGARLLRRQPVWLDWAIFRLFGVYIWQLFWKLQKRNQNTFGATFFLRKIYAVIFTRTGCVTFWAIF
jgi:hypothetical protein